jgi:uncharacterized RDD family membrane protein YckC
VADDAATNVADDSRLSDGLDATDFPLKPAGFWRRLAAYGIDYLIYIGIMVICGVVLGIQAAMTVDPAREVEPWIYWTVALGVGWLYWALFERTTWQATPGKRLLDIIVTDDSSERISFRRATGRHVARYLSFLVFGVGFLMIAFTSNKGGLHDILSGTRVVRRPRRQSPAIEPVREDRAALDATVAPPQPDPTLSSTHDAVGRAVPL